MLKVRGWQVSPAELEAALLLHPAIADAAVVGIRLKQGYDTELPRAYVVKLADSDLSEHQIHHFMASQVSRYKSLDGGIVFVDTVPRNSGGKVQRDLLRERAATEVYEINDIDGKVILASTMLNGKPSSDGGRISLDSSVMSYDGSNETGMRSRRNSSSTVGTINSEITGWTPKGARLAASTKDDSKYHGHQSQSHATSDLPPEHDDTADLKSHIERVFAEHGRRGSDVEVPCGLPHLPGFERTCSTLQVSVDPPTSTGKAPFLPETTTSVSDPPALCDFKKRTAENMGNIKAPVKRPRTDSEADRSCANGDETYQPAMTMRMPSSSSLPPLDWALIQQTLGCTVSVWSVWIKRGWGAI